MRRQVLRPAFITTFSAAIATVATACGGRAAGTATSDGGVSTETGAGDGGVVPPGEGGVVPPGEGGADCPAQAPAPYSPCSVPASMECSWPDACGGGRIGWCGQGHWNIEYMNPPAPGCPTSPPLSGTPCPCDPAPQGCSYPGAGTCNGQPQDETATCPLGGTWQLSFPSCNPPATYEGGVPDAAAPTDAATEAD